MHIFTWPDDRSAERLDRALTELLPDFSRTHIKRHIDAGQVTVKGHVITQSSHKVHPGDVFSLEILETAALDLEPVAMDLDIVYEDAHLLVINKPAGLVVHPGAGTYEPTLVHGLLHHCKDQLSGIGGVERPGIVHRLDKDTSGLMVVAKEDKAHQGLTQQFQTRSLKRKYIAFVYGVPMPFAGTIEGSIGRDVRQRKKMQVRHFGGKEAVTHYQVLEEYYVPNSSDVLVSKVECELETGRTHQIRVHMLAKGHGLLGDVTYVDRTHKRAILKRLLAEKEGILWSSERQALHAYHIRFEHPITGVAHKFKVPLPEDLLALEAFLADMNAYEEG